MYTTINVLNDEANKLIKATKMKMNYLILPVNILPKKEIKDLKENFKNFTSKFSSEYKKYMEDKEQKINSNKKFLEDDSKIDELFETVKQKDEKINNDIEYLSREFDKIYKADLDYINKHDIHNSEITSRSQSSNSSSKSDFGESELLIISKIFLNTIVTSNDMNNLKQKNSVQEEREFLMSLLKIEELFPKFASKRYIVCDYFMDVYSFCQKNYFTIQQMSVIISIFYFMFSYSFSKSTSNLEKSRNLYKRIIDYHSTNRPPFSYQFFNQNEKNKLIDYANQTLFRNYSLYESIFRYEVSICFFSKSPIQIPHNHLPTNEDNYKLKNELIKPTDEIPQIMKDIVDNIEHEEDEQDDKDDDNKKNKETEKTNDEIDDEKRIKELKEFVQSFYNSFSEYDKAKMQKLEEIEKAQKEKEGNLVRQIMDNKLVEIHKDIDEKISESKKEQINQIDEFLNEKDKTKKK